jgi:hypothetical protein
MQGYLTSQGRQGMPTKMLFSASIFYLIDLDYTGSGHSQPLH